MDHGWSRNCRLSSALAVERSGTTAGHGGGATQ
jgi:hypothetical protein